MTSQPKRPQHQGDARKPTEEKELDRALEDTFPASDPPAATQGITGIPDAVHDDRERAEQPSRKKEQGR